MSDLRIMLIDDSQSDLLLYKRHLQKGFTDEKLIFAEAGSGEEALKTYVDFKPDAIVLDYNLPDTDGHALLKKIKAADLGADPCVIVITASGNEKVAVKLMKEGANDYLSKDDLTQDKLSSSLRASLEKCKLQKELKVKEAKIAANESKLRLILNTIPHIVFKFIESFDNTTFLNKKTYEYTGAPAGKIFNLKDYIHPEDIESSVPHWEKSIKEGKDFHFDLRLKSACGKYHWMETIITPIKDESEEIVEWIGSCTDIHDKKLHIEKLNRSTANLQDLNDNLYKLNSDLDSFVYTASHDLKAPINNLELLISHLIEVMGKNDEASELLGMTAESIERLKKTVDNLSEILVIENDNHSIKNISFQEVYDHIKYDLQKQILEAGANIKVDFSEASFMSIQPKNLRSVIYNIFSNALKYRDPERPLEIDIYTKKIEPDHVLLSIKDNGLGLKSSDKEAVFSLFKRVHDHVEGSGIGLSLVKKIVDANGGKIELESEIGKGSEFRIFFKL